MGVFFIYFEIGRDLLKRFECFPYIDINFPTIYIWILHLYIELYNTAIIIKLSSRL